MILYQIPQTNIMRIILQTVRGIDNEILGVKGLSHDYENEIGWYDKIYINQKMMKSIESKLFWVILVGKT